MLTFPVFGFSSEISRAAHEVGLGEGDGGEENPQGRAEGEGAESQVRTRWQRHSAGQRSAPGHTRPHAGQQRRVWLR